MSEATQVVQTAPVAAPVVGSETTAPAIAPETGQEAPAVDQPPARLFTQDEVDKFITKRLSKAERAWERRHQSLMEAALGGGRRQEQNEGAQAPTPASEEAPDPSKFADFGQYVQALVAHGVQGALAANAKNTQQLSVREQAAQRQQIVADGVKKQFAAGAEKYDDFEDLVSSPDLPITAPMAEAIAESDLGVEVAYFLGKNPAEAMRIAQMSPLAAVREIGKLEAKLTIAAPATSSAAPKPVTPVKGSGGDKDPAVMTDAEFAAWRKKSIAARRGR